MDGSEGGIFSKDPNWKSLFLLKIKIKKTPSCQTKNIMPSSRTFIGTSWPVAEVKKSLH